ncbi:MAG: redoxin domain-containing protein [Acidimicrobiales bacterium]|nr:redoxin domain-containing protein [Acidimicrobiales bacterium]
MIARPRSAELVSMQIGDPVEDFTLSDDTGGRWRLSEHRGRPVLLIFHRHLM